MVMSSARRRSVTIGRRYYSSEDMRTGMKMVVFLWILLVALLALTFYPWVALLRALDSGPPWFVPYLARRGVRP